MFGHFTFSIFHRYINAFLSRSCLQSYSDLCDKQARLKDVEKMQQTVICQQVLSKRCSIKQSTVTYSCRHVLAVVWKHDMCDGVMVTIIERTLNAVFQGQRINNSDATIGETNCWQKEYKVKEKRDWKTAVSNQQTINWLLRSNNRYIVQTFIQFLTYLRSSTRYVSTEIIKNGNLAIYLLWFDFEDKALSGSSQYCWWQKNEKLIGHQVTLCPATNSM